jgi:hypothetical protein
MKKLIPWIKKIGIIGFLFFLVKGLVWLALILGMGSIFTK